MNRIVTVLFLGSALAGTGCVSKAEHAALQAQLDTCQQDKAAAQESAAAVQRRLESDGQALAGIRADVGAVLPQVRSDFEEERKRILAIVPEEVRSQVGRRLDKQFAAISGTLLDMNGSLESLTANVAGLQTELAASQATLEALRGQTQVVETKVDATHDAAVARNEQVSGHLAEQRRQIAAVTQAVVDFDAARLSCSDCAERLKMKDTARDELVAFHRKLVTDMNALATKSVSGT